MAAATLEAPTDLVDEADLLGCWTSVETFATGEGAGDGERCRPSRSGGSESLLPGSRRSKTWRRLCGFEGAEGVGEDGNAVEALDPRGCL